MLNEFLLVYINDRILYKARKEIFKAIHLLTTFYSAWMSEYMIENWKEAYGCLAKAIALAEITNSNKLEQKES